MKLFSIVIAFFLLIHVQSQVVINEYSASNMNGIQDAFGDNEVGQLGLGHNNDEKKPQLIDPNHFDHKTIQSIHLGYHHKILYQDQLQ